MKKLATIICLFSFAICFAQNENTKNKITENNEVKITSMSYDVDNAKELESIDWESVKEIFSTNKDDQEIKMTFGINLKKSKNKIKAKFSVGGKSENIDSLIIKAKKGIKSIIKLSNKYKND